ncbi:MAG: protein-export chaperone SecB [Desulfobacterales bacterium]|nr:protein-export chaperone SecB [Desulfobacterales bacterium]
MSSMNFKSIQLKYVYFEINSDFIKELNIPINYDISINNNFNEDTKNLSLDLTIETPNKEKANNYPFFFKITLSGVFEFKESIEQKLFDSYIKINCPSIMFPYIRETLADIIRRSGFPPIHLPPINFLKMYEKTSQ